MTEDELTQKLQRILTRLRTERWTPMMRFAFLDWTHADYEALDGRLGVSPVPTRRCVLPEDHGILVGCGSERTPPFVAMSTAPDHRIHSHTATRTPVTLTETRIDTRFLGYCRSEGEARMPGRRR